MKTPSFSLQILKKEEAIPWPGTLAIVHSYIAYKEGDGSFCSSRVSRLPGPASSDRLSHLCLAAKEEEKQKLMKWSSELKLEREQLEQRVKQLSNSITVSSAHTFMPRSSLQSLVHNLCSAKVIKSFGCELAQQGEDCQLLSWPCFLCLDVG